MCDRLRTETRLPRERRVPLRPDELFGCVSRSACFRPGNRSALPWSRPFARSSHVGGASTRDATDHRQPHNLQSTRGKQARRRIAQSDLTIASPPRPAARHCGARSSHRTRDSLSPVARPQGRNAATTRASGQSPVADQPRDRCHPPALRPIPPHRRARADCGHERPVVPPTFPGGHCHEPAAISEANQTTRSAPPALIEEQ